MVRAIGVWSAIYRNQSGAIRRAVSLREAFDESQAIDGIGSACADDVEDASLRIVREITNVDDEVRHKFPKKAAYRFDVPGRAKPQVRDGTGVASPQRFQHVARMPGST
jgi:hypothetical protein